MSDLIKAKGSCLCGAVTVSASIHSDIGSCHCDMCRKWSGSPMMATQCEGVPQFDGEDNIAVYQSSEWAERGFCKQCGSHLFYRLKGKHQYHMPIGFFGELSNLKLSHQIFIDEKPSFYDFANKTDNMTGAEVFAKAKECLE